MNILAWHRQSASEQMIPVTLYECLSLALFINSQNSFTTHRNRIGYVRETDISYDPIFHSAKLCINPMQSVWKSFSVQQRFRSNYVFCHQWIIFQHALCTLISVCMKSGFTLTAEEATKHTHTYTHSRKNKLQSISAVKVYQWRHSFCVCLMFALRYHFV